MHARVRDLRRRLLELPAFRSLPRCGFCGSEVKPLEYSQHSRQCERDRLSQCIEALDRKLAWLWSYQPRTQAEVAAIDAEQSRLGPERHEKWLELLATTPDAPGWPEDGLPL